jgi:hypothetical protein
MVAKHRARRSAAPWAGSIWLGAVAGIAVGLVASVALVAAGVVDEPEPERFETDPEAVAELLDAWQRSRFETFVVVSRFTRTVEGRSGLAATTTLVQDPPTRFVSQSGSVTGRVGDTEVACTTGPGGDLQCLPGRDLPSYDEEALEEIALLRRYVDGPGRDLYFVDEPQDGCYRLRLAYEVPTPPLGEVATYCFDDATGAPTRTEIVRREGRDLTEAVEIRTEVTARDLDPVVQ